MTLSGWIIFTLAVGTMTALFLWCIVKVLRGDDNPSTDTNDTEP
jgi:hypothetical protein